MYNAVYCFIWFNEMIQNTIEKVSRNAVSTNSR